MFKTKDGAEWDLTLDVGHLAALRTDAGFDLTAAMKSGDALAMALFGDPETFAGVLWVIVREQAEKRGVDREAFYRVLGPQAVDAAADAFVQALVDFYHRRRAPAIKAQLPALLATLDRKHTEVAEAAMSAALRSYAGDSPESSASIPDG